MEILQHLGQQSPLVSSTTHTNLHASSARTTSSFSFTPVSSPYHHHHHHHNAAAAKAAASDLPLQACASFNAINAPPAAGVHGSRRPLRGRHRPGRTLIFMRSNAAAGYAAALAEIGQSKRVLDLIHADLKKLAAILQHKQQVRTFLLHPSIEGCHKKRILARLAEEAAFVPYTLRVLNLIVEKKSAGLLQEVVKEFEAIYRQIASTDVAFVLSATQLDPAQLARIVARDIPDDMPPAMTGYIIDYGQR